MNFFTQLAETEVQNLELKVVTKNDVMSVIITPVMKDKNKSIVPLTVSGTAQELDEGFFDVITNPLKKAAGLTSNVEEFEKSLEEKPLEQKADTTKTEPKAKAAPKPKPYKHQKYLDPILEIINAEGFVLSEENKKPLSEAVNKLLVMDSKNEVALEWEEKIKDLSPKQTEIFKEEIVEEKVVPEVKKEEPKAVTPPPAPQEEEGDDDDFFDDSDLDLDMESFFDN